MTALVAPARPRAAPPVTGAPHLNGAQDLRSVQGTVALALAPCALVALWNTGRQANLVLAGHPAGVGPDTRARWLEAWGIGLDAGDVAACAAHGSLYLVPALAVALATGFLWEHLFARLRRRARTPGLLALAAIFTLLLPPAAPLWQVALGMSFGVVFGKEVFGGTGMGFLPPAALGIAFLRLAYPDAMADDARWPGLAGYAGSKVFAQVAATGADTLRDAGLTWTQAFLGDEPGRLGETSTLACLLGAGLLVLRPLVSWRSIVAMPLGLVLGLWALDALDGGSNPVLALPWYDHLVLGGTAFGTVFLAADPTTAPLTETGRLAHGLVAGFAVAWMRADHPAHPDAAVFAVLFAGVFAPLIDHLVVTAHARRRARRHA
jgi:Na+-transporting NADH:ubiquinone oxidoreductase subunit B